MTYCWESNLSPSITQISVLATGFWNDASAWIFFHHQPVAPEKLCCAYLWAGITLKASRKTYNLCSRVYWGLSPVLQLDLALLIGVFSPEGKELWKCCLFLKFQRFRGFYRFLIICYVCLSISEPIWTQNVSQVDFQNLQYSSYAEFV